MLVRRATDGKRFRTRIDGKKRKREHSIKTQVSLLVGCFILQIHVVMVPRQTSGAGDGRDTRAGSIGGTAVSKPLTLTIVESSFLLSLSELGVNGSTGEMGSLNALLLAFEADRRWFVRRAFPSCCTNTSSLGRFSCQ